MTKKLLMRSAAGLQALALAALLASCGGGDDATTDTAPAAGKAAPAATSPGKPTAPITIDYSIVGNPVVGQPVMLNLRLDSTLDDRPITVTYRINEAGSMTFPDSQPQTLEVLPLAGATQRSQQITVVPQREGRLFLVVSAEVQDDDGRALIKTMSIPIRAGRALAAPDMNGEVVQGADGGAPGISMPATEPR